MKLVHISIGTKDSHMMNSAVRHILSEGYDLEFHCFDAADLDADPVLLADALRTVASSDMLTLKVHGDTSYFKQFDRLERTLADYDVSALLDCTDQSVIDAYRHLFKGTDEDHLLGLTYLELGGDENSASLIK